MVPRGKSHASVNNRPRININLIWNQKCHVRLYFKTFILMYLSHLWRWNRWALCSGINSEGEAPETTACSHTGDTWDPLWKPKQGVGGVFYGTRFSFRSVLTSSTETYCRPANTNTDKVMPSIKQVHFSFVTRRWWKCGNLWGTVVFQFKKATI